MKKFFSNMISGASDVSSRRIVGLTAFALIAIISIIDVAVRFNLARQGKPMPESAIVSEFIFNGLMTIVLGCFLLTTASSFKANQVKETVASTLAESGEPKAAINAMQSDKPAAEV